jgi:hypothetical protein
MKHDFAIPRGAGTIEISIDGAAWEAAADHATGPSQFAGSSGGWKISTLDFGTALAGHTIQLRWHIKTGNEFHGFSFDSQSTYWALSTIGIQGAAQSVFSSMHPDVN